jgi:transposase
VKVLCLDEIALKKGHGQYKLVISAPELGIVLDLLPDRRKETLEAWFEARGVSWCDQVEVCCADMWDAYHSAAQAKLRHARQVVDRFHLMKNLTEALNKARRTLQKQADEATKERLKGARWLLVKNREQLSAEEGQTLEAILAASPALKTCYELKESLRTWFNDTTERTSAEAQLAVWIAKARATGVKALITFTCTLQNWHERILNYFDGRHSNGFAEGINLKIKLLARRAFGFRNFDRFRLLVLVAFSPKTLDDSAFT